MKSRHVDDEKRKKQWGKKIHLARQEGSPTDRVFAVAASSHVDTSAFLSSGIFFKSLDKLMAQCALFLSLPLCPFRISQKLTYSSRSLDALLSALISQRKSKSVRIAGIECTVRRRRTESNWIPNTN